MFFIQFEVTPRQTPHQDVAGAFVNCWIERDTLDEAVVVGREMIIREGWIVGDPEEAYSVDTSTYPPGKAGREYFIQALTDREVLVFHSYGNEPEEESSAES